MSMDTDEDRIAKKAHELWEAEGQPHGRDREHWDEAKEIIALQDSADDMLLPRDTGAQPPVEERSIAIDNEGEVPNLNDTGEHDLTSIDREPAITAPVTKPAKKSVAKRTAPTAAKSGPVARDSKAARARAKAQPAA